MGIHSKISLIFLAVFFLFGCIKIDLQDDVFISKKKTQAKMVVVEDDTRQCKLNGLVHRLQEDSSWCWVASTQMAIEHITNTPIDSQCDFASEILKPELAEKKQENALTVQNRPIECCQAIGKPSPTTLTGDSQPNDITTQLSGEVCLRGGWPHFVFNSLEKNTGKGYWWEEKNDWGNTHSDLVWKQVNDEICQDRPIIFVVRWDESGGGGRHTAVVGGTRLIGGVKYVEVYDHYTMDEGTDFFLMPFDIFLGEEGEFEHEFDYIKIQSKP